MNVPNTLRTRKSEEAYAEFRAKGGRGVPCALCAEDVIQTFKHWKIITNLYPYDRIAKVHHMVLPLRHATGSHITEEEWAELDELKKGYINEHYEYFLEPVLRNKSIPTHYHLHLINLKERED